MSASFQKQLGQLKKRKLFFVLLILVAVVAVIWIMTSIFTSGKHAEIDKEMETAREALEVNIDEELLSRLSQKKMFTETELSNFPIYRLRSTEKMNYTEFRTTGEIERNLNVNLTFGEFDASPTTVSTDNTTVSEPIPEAISQPIE